MSKNDITSPHKSYAVKIHSSLLEQHGGSPTSISANLRPRIEKTMATRLFVCRYYFLFTSQTFKAIPSKTHERRRQCLQQYLHFVLTALYSSEMAESTQQEDFTTGKECHEDTGVLGGNVSKIIPAKIERLLDLESIKIDLPPENKEITYNSEGSGREKEQHSSRSADTVPNTQDEKRVEMRRRNGAVEANDTAQDERRKARVFSKKFGEEMLHKKPSIFNKKL